MYEGYEKLNVRFFSHRPDPSPKLTPFPPSSQLPDWKGFTHPQGKDVSAMKAVGAYLEEVVALNPHSFRIFSPDELASNKLDAVFSKTHRNMQCVLYLYLPCDEAESQADFGVLAPGRDDPETANNGGRVIEMLSEHTLQGFLQGTFWLFEPFERGTG